VQTNSKDVLMTASQPQVMADLKKEDARELVVPHIPADNKKDSEPMNIQLKDEKK
jgi:hypothetical protein